jgi:uroporphyrinogen-III synthase
MDRLFTHKIFISTRPEGQSDELARLFAAAGARILELPMIKIQPTILTESEKNQLRQPGNFDWLTFTSPNGVRYFFENMQNLTGSIRLPEHLRIAVIGKKTETTLKDFGYSPSFSNPGKTGEDFADSFTQKIKEENGARPDILMPLGNLAGTLLQERLNPVARCFRINVYETVMPGSVDEIIFQHIREDRYDMIIFTSPSGIYNFLKLKGSINDKTLRVACIGETTFAAARKKGITPLVVASKPTARGIFESIISYYKHQYIKK